jgi:hypothetical protein
MFLPRNLWGGIHGLGKILHHRLPLEVWWQWTLIFRQRPLPVDQHPMCKLGQLAVRVKEEEEMEDNTTFDSSVLDGATFGVAGNVGPRSHL